MSDKETLIRKIKLSEIKTADKNPKDHDVGAIYQSMKRFGFVAFPLVNSTTDKLLAGHGRLKTLHMIKSEGEFVPANIEVTDDGDWLVPCIYSATIEDEAEAQAYLLADNRLTEIGGYNNMDLLDSLQEVIKETGSLDGTGWDLDSIEDIIADMERSSFEVKEYGDDSVEDETSVQVSVGRYKFKINADEFYEWEETVKSQTQTSEVNEINDWIKNQLGLT
jgi:hypothetical protein|tara:strand:+ start:6169 stop:6831 length:663 start_codon:yes stop_codon:yes gene_type:complete